MAPQEPMIHSFNSKKSSDTLSTPTFVMIIVIAIVLGLATGFGIAYFKGNSSTTTTTTNAVGTTETTANSAGVKNSKAFPDKAEGTLKAGGMEGEGSFHLVRPGGDSQNVYLTSTAVDLSKFVGKKVQVWGQTFSAEKAGWLMDVGYVEIKN